MLLNSQYNGSYQKKTSTTTVDTVIRNKKLSN